MALKHSFLFNISFGISIYNHIATTTFLKTSAPQF